SRRGIGLRAARLPRRRAPQARPSGDAGEPRPAAGLESDRVGPVGVVGEAGAGDVLHSDRETTFASGQGTGDEKVGVAPAVISVKACDVPDTGELSVDVDASLLVRYAAVEAAAQVDAVIARSDGEREPAVAAVAAATVGDDGRVVRAGVG